MSGDRVPAGNPDHGVRIRPARGADIAAVREVEVASFTVPWGESSFRSLLGLSRVFFLVAESDGSVVGHGVLWWMADEGELANLAVHPDARGRGIAGALLDELLGHAREVRLSHVYLEVRDSNRTALELYRSRAFREVGVRKAYYRRPREDARVLRLELGAHAAAGDARPVREPGDPRSAGRAREGTDRMGASRDEPPRDDHLRPMTP